jgi:hypothetical protein
MKRGCKIGRKLIDIINICGFIIMPILVTFLFCHTFLLEPYVSVRNTIFFRIIITFLSSTKYLQSILCKCNYNEENLKQILRFCKLLFSLIMLMLLSVQIVQTNNNEFS